MRRAAVPAALAAIFALAPMGAGANDVCVDNGGHLVFHCKIKDSTRVVTACEIPGKRFFYMYGRPGKPPELVLERGEKDLLYTPWPGIGRAFWASLSFFNGGYRYELAWSVDKDRSDDARATEGALVVYAPGKEDPAATKRCSAGTVEVGLTFDEDRFPVPPRN